MLAPGGVLVFQLPERVHDNPRERFLSAPVESGAFKRGLPRQVVRAWRAVKYL